MKTFVKLPFVVALAFVFLSPGCKKSEPPVADTSPALQQAFETAAPDLKASIAAVAASLKDKKFTDAVTALEPIVAKPQLTGPQQQALLAAVLQINEAIANDPKLDAPGMAARRAKLFEALRRGSR
ncbi:MAG: hypothetical protein U1F83_05300 [Verrucomicrobiota bacterium]